MIRNRHSSVLGKKRLLIRLLVRWWRVRRLKSRWPQGGSLGGYWLRWRIKWGKCSWKRLSCFDIDWMDLIFLLFFFIYMFLILIRKYNNNSMAKIGDHSDFYVYVYNNNLKWIDNPNCKMPSFVLKFSRHNFWKRKKGIWMPKFVAHITSCPRPTPAPDPKSKTFLNAHRSNSKLIFLVFYFCFPYFL